MAPNIALLFWKLLAYDFRVETFSDFISFSVAAKSYNCLSARCASASNAIGNVLLYLLEVQSAQMIC